MENPMHGAAAGVRKGMVGADRTAAEAATQPPAFPEAGFEFGTVAAGQGGGGSGGGGSTPARRPGSGSYADPVPAAVGNCYMYGSAEVHQGNSITNISGGGGGSNQQPLYLEPVPVGASYEYGLGAQAGTGTESKGQIYSVYSGTAGAHSYVAAGNATETLYSVPMEGPAEGQGGGHDYAAVVVQQRQGHDYASASGASTQMLYSVPDEGQDKDQATALNSRGMLNDALYSSEQGADA